MDLLIESKTLYAVSFFDTAGDEVSLAEFCYQRIIAWGPELYIRPSTHSGSYLSMGC
jgi:hypothetical protein